MADFRYSIQTSSGKTSSGVLQAASINEAMNLARSKGTVLDVTPVETENLLQKMQNLSVEFGPGLKDVLSFTSQLTVMIRAGINIRTAIAAIADQTEHRKFQGILRQIKDDVEGGQTFSDALAKHPKVFPPMYINMVRASELSGNLGHMLQRVQSYLSQQMETRRMVIGAMCYPMIIFTLAVSTVVFMLAWVLPRFTGLFAGKEHLLPKPTTLLMGMSDALRNDWPMLLGGLVLVIGSIMFVIKKTEKGALLFDKFKLKVPLMKNMFRALYISRGLHTMGELVRAGVPMLDTLRITADISGNRLYENMWLRVHDGVKQGSKIVDPLSRQTLLPANVVQMVSAGEESGNLGEVLGDVAEYYQEELKATIKAVTSMIEPLMIVFMGFVVGFIAMAIMLPIFKMSAVVKG
ncbi:MAG: type II secretion system F family protein [Phycisphaerae bacterium]